MRRARAEATSTSPAVTLASTSCTLRPGRTTEAWTSSGATGTGRNNSTVRRATCTGSGASQLSTARARSAATGPPWSASGAQGPRAKSAGTRSAPSEQNRASATKGSVGRRFFEAVEHPRRRARHEALVGPVHPPRRRQRAAVGVQRRAGDVGRQLGRQEQHAVADVGRQALSLQRDGELVAGVLATGGGALTARAGAARHPREPDRGYEVGRHAVHTDARRSQLGAERARQVGNRRLH